MNPDLMHVQWDLATGLTVHVSPLLLVLVLLLALLGLLWHWRGLHRFTIVKVTFPLPGGSSVELSPNEQDLQIAHRIWTELITRKAALPFDPEHDVITEVYDSWYALFGTIRGLIADVPARLIRDEQSTRDLVRIATDTLNQGLRPHLTTWQARFRNWYAQQSGQLATNTPQEVQRTYPDYASLVADLVRVNAQLITYAEALKKVVDGR